MSYFDYRRVKFVDDAGAVLPRQPLLELAGVSIVNDETNGKLVITPSGQLALTPVTDNGDMIYGQHQLQMSGASPIRTLPAASSAQNGCAGITMTYSGTLTINALDSEVEVDSIQGESSISITEGQSVTLQSDGGTTWWVVASYLP